MGFTVLLAALAALLPVWRLLAGYVGGNAFPQPLSPEEEQAALEALRAGSVEARARLIEHNLRLVAHVAKKFETHTDDVDDLISIGTVGLIKAVDSFDPAKGVRLATYAARCIENEILMYFRYQKKSRGEVSLYDAIGVDREGNEITLLDVLGSDPEVVPDQVATQIQLESLQGYLGSLDPKERLVVETRFGIGTDRRRTQREVARALGISRSYVSRIEKRAVQKLLREIDPDAVTACRKQAEGAGPTSGP
ncbi:MAG: RNA polymerase sporulation sigma factor SigK [Actinomycetia bacterium]|nr:RNA polymerase sporulation sigma factor SigK [Actinomycetes bacterium]